MPCEYCNDTGKESCSRDVPASTCFFYCVCRAGRVLFCDDIINNGGAPQVPVDAQDAEDARAGRKIRWLKSDTDG